MNDREILRKQLDMKLVALSEARQVQIPPTGWIEAIRRSLNMSMRQLGQRLSVSPQTVQRLEEREQSGAVTLRSLKKAARALDMDFVYGFLPREGSLEQMIEKRANEVATRIVQQTSVQMELEDQRNTDERLAQAIKEQSEELKRILPRFLWD